MNCRATFYYETKENDLDNNLWAKAGLIFFNKPKLPIGKTWQWWSEKNHNPILALVAIASLGANIGLMTWLISVNRMTTDLNIRPYVYIDMKSPKRYETQRDTFYGNDIFILNKGKIKASNVEPKYYITTDKDKTNRESKEYFEKNYGGYPTQFVIPPESILTISGERSLSPNAEYYYFEALISYEGFDETKKYWTHIKKAFYVDKENKRLILVHSYGEWDRNKNFDEQRISLQGEVEKLFDKFKLNRKNN